MNSDTKPSTKVLMAMRDNGISSVLFRNAIGRKLGLNITDYECLSYLSIKGVATPTELAKYTGLTTGSATAMLDRLEKARFITRVPNPNDRRGLLVEISDRYKEMAGPLVGGLVQEQNKLIADYSDKELELIADFLTRFTNNVNDQIKTIDKI